MRVQQGSENAYIYRGVEQLVARQAHNLEVACSSPAPATILKSTHYSGALICFYTGMDVVMHARSCLGDNLDFHQYTFWQAFYGDSRTGGIWLGEEFRIDGVHVGKVAGKVFVCRFRALFGFV